MPTAHAYAPRTPRHQRRRVGRALIVAALILVPLTAIYFGRPALSAAVNTYRLRQAARYTLPEGTIIYSELPADAGLPSTGGYHALVPVAEAPTRIVHDAPPTWPRLRDRVHSFGPVNEGDALLFLHERTAPNGESRIVVVTLWLKETPTPELTTRLAIEVHLITPPEHWADAPREGYHSTEGQGVRTDGLDTAFTPGQLRFFAGQPDPANPARFTIPWEFNGTRHTLTGTLDTENRGVFDPNSIVVHLQDIP